MGMIRISVSGLALILMLGCSKPDNNKQAPTTAMFGGCPITTNGEDFTGNASAIPKGIYSNGSSYVYTVGVLKDPKNPDFLGQAITRLSTDGGKTFSTIDQSNGLKGEGAINNAVIVDSSNANIYVAQTYKNGSVRSANIHYSIDGGAAWKDSPFQLNGQNNESLTSIALSPSGAPVFVGTSIDSSKKKTGFVISFDVNKKTTQLLQSLENSELKQIVAQGDDLFVVGASISENKTSWLLEKWVGAEKDSNKKWVNLSNDNLTSNFAFPNVLDEAKDESFSNLIRFSKIYSELVPILKAASDGAKGRLPQTPPAPILTPLSGSANAILVTGDGFIFVAGTVNAPKKDDSKLVEPTKSTTEPDIWVVRKSGNNGVSFTTSDIFNDGAFKTLIPSALVEYDNHVIAVGGSKNISTDSHWHVRGTQDKSSAWVTLSSPKLSDKPKAEDPEESARAVGGVIVGSGDKKYLVVLGDSHESDGIHHWRIQQTTSCTRPH